MTYYKTLNESVVYYYDEKLEKYKPEDNSSYICSFDENANTYYDESSKPNYRELYVCSFIIIDNTLNEESNHVADFRLKSDSKQEYNIFVYPSDEGKLPHFHIKVKDKPDTCILILKNRYFIHGVHKGTLTSKECKALDEVLRQNHLKTPALTNWEKIHSHWITCNSLESNMSYRKYTSYTQPDYKTIPGNYK